MCMNKLLLLIFTLTLSSCATYKIAPDDDFNYSELRSSSNEEIFIEDRTADIPGGLQCFEPMLYVLTLGIIPQHCIYNYEVTNKHNAIGNVEVTHMQGWVALLVTLFPSWHYGNGHGDDIENKIMDKLNELK